MDLSIIIVNWNSAKYLRPCLASIYKHTRGLTFEIIVVDNASYDGSADIVRDEYPDVIFIQSERNLGFARANNLGYRQSSGSALLFLNPDTELVNDALARMVTYLNSSATVGAVGCRLLNSDLSLQTSCIQAFPTLWNQLLDAELLRRILPAWKLWGMSALSHYNGKPLEVEVVSGACIMVNRAVFEAVGPFSEEYFMYADDVDLCYLIKTAGYSVQYVGDATVIHHGGKSSASREESQFAAVMQRESRARFFRKRRGELFFWLYRA